MTWILVVHLDKDVSWLPWFLMATPVGGSPEKPRHTALKLRELRGDARVPFDGTASALGSCRAAQPPKEGDEDLLAWLEDIGHWRTYFGMKTWEENFRRKDGGVMMGGVYV